MALQDIRTINGSFGKVYHDGKWLTNFNEVTADVEQVMREVLPSGTRWVGNKVVGLRGTGRIRGYKVTSELLEMASQIFDDTKGVFITELIFKLDDPEAFGSERVRLTNVKFERIPIANWTPQDLIMEEWSFVFAGIELLDVIEEA